MKIFGDASDCNATLDKYPFPLIGIQHPNFVDICEAYLFRKEIFAIVKYGGFSVQELLQYSIYPNEVEIAYIISQVNIIFTAFLFHFDNDALGFGRYTICLVKGSSSSGKLV